MRARVGFLLLVLLIAALLLLVTRRPAGEERHAVRPGGSTAPPPDAITLRGRAAAVPVPPAAALPREVAPTESEDDPPPVPLPLRLVLEGQPDGTALDPPVHVQVAARTDPIDSFASFGVGRDVLASGPVEIDVRSVLDEIGRLGRAPEIMVFVRQPDAMAEWRSFLVADVEGLRAGRVRLDPLTFTLHPTTPITGRVLTSDGAPIATAAVRAYAMPGSAPEATTANAVSVDEDGSFTLRLAGEGRFLLVAVAVPWDERERPPGHRWVSRSRLIVIEPGEAPAPVELRLEEGRAVRGEVIDPHYGLRGGDGRVHWELEDRAVRLQGQPDALAWIGGDVVWAEGDAYVADGAFVVSGVPLLRCIFSVVHHETLCLERGVGPTVLVPPQDTLRLEPACAAIELTLEVDGETSTSASLWVEVVPASGDAPARERTVSSGSVLLASPQSAFRIVGNDPRFASVSVDVTTGRIGETTRVTIPLRRVSRSDVNVRLCLPDGSPYTGWASFVAAELSSPRERPRRVWEGALYGRGGFFPLTGLPEGRWRLHLRPGRTIFGGRPSGYLETTGEVMVPPDRDPEATLVVATGGRLVVSVRDDVGLPRGGRIAIRDAAGTPVPAAFVGEHDLFRTEEASGAGVLPPSPVSWLATALEPGTYEVEITPEGGRTSLHTVSVAAGETVALAVRVE